MKFQLVSRQSSETVGADPNTPNTQLTFSGTDNPTAATPGIFFSSLVLAVTQAEASRYTLGAYYDMDLTESPAEAT